jgi:hypothetical protein
MHAEEAVDWRPSGLMWRININSCAHVGLPHHAVPMLVATLDEDPAPSVAGQRAGGLSPEQGVRRRRLSWRSSASGSWPMLDGLAYDDCEPPMIGLVPAGVAWDEVKDHIKIAHSPLLAGPDASGQYAGAYWAGTELVVADDLGPDQEQALREFRDFLHERGET